MRTKKAQKKKEPLPEVEPQASSFFLPLRLRAEENERE
jgi:hypothetical protein